MDEEEQPAVVELNDAVAHLELTTASTRERIHLLQQVIVPRLQDTSRELSDGDIKSFLKALFGTLHRYRDRASKLGVLNTFSALCARDASRVASFALPALTRISTSSVGACAVLMDWSCCVVAAAPVQLFTEKPALIKAALAAQGTLLVVAGDANGVSAYQKIARRLVAMLQKGPASLVSIYWSTVLAACKDSPSQTDLAIGSLLSTCSSSPPSTDHALLKPLYTAYATMVTSSRSVPSAGILVATAPLFAVATLEDLRDIIVPAFERALLRVPECVLDALAYTLGHVSKVDISPFLGSLGNTVCSQLLAKSIAVRAASLTTLSTMARCSQSADALLVLANTLLETLAGKKSGKITSAELRVTLLAGLVAVADVDGSTFSLTQRAFATSFTSTAVATAGSAASASSTTSSAAAATASAPGAGTAGSSAALSADSSNLLAAPPVIAVADASSSSSSSSSSSRVSAESLSMTASHVIQQLMTVIATEANELVQTTATIALRAWSSRLQSWPDALSEPCTKALAAAPSKTPAANLLADRWLVCLEAVSSVCAPSIPASISKALGELVVRDIAAGVPNTLASSAAIAANVLLGICIETATNPSAAFWASVCSPRIFMTERQSQSASHDVQLTQVNLIGRLVRVSVNKDDSATVSSVSNLCTTSVLLLLASKLWRVRTAAADILVAAAIVNGSLAYAESLVRAYITLVSTRNNVSHGGRAANRDLAGVLAACCALPTATTDPSVGNAANASLAALALAAAQLPAVRAFAPSSWHTAVTACTGAVDAEKYVCRFATSLLRFLAAEATACVATDADWQDACLRAITVVATCLADSDSMDAVPVVHALKPIFADWLNVTAVGELTPRDVGVYLTNEGTLFDSSAVDALGSSGAGARSGGKDAAWEAQVRAELAKKKGEVVLTAKQKQVQAQLLKDEAEVRERVALVDQVVSRGLNLALLLCRRLSTACELAERLVPTLLHLSGLPLTGKRAALAWIELLRTLAALPAFSATFPFGTLETIGFVTLRRAVHGAAQSGALFDPEWCVEPLAQAMDRSLANVAHSIALVPITTALFACLWPVSRVVLRDQAAPASLVESAVTIVAQHASLGVTWAGDSSLPPSIVAALSASVELHASACARARDAVVDWSTNCGASMSHGAGLSALCNGLWSPSSPLREGCLRALTALSESLEMPADSVHIWTATFDDVLTNVDLAQALWRRFGVPHTAGRCLSLVELTSSDVDYVRDVATKALAASLDNLGDTEDAEATAALLTDRLIEMHADLSRVIAPERDQFGNLVGEPPRDRWQARVGVATAMERAAVGLCRSTPAIMRIFQLLADGNALGDRESSVRAAILKAGMALIDACGARLSTELLAVFEDFLDAPHTSSSIYDYTREGVVVLMGSLARHFGAGESDRVGPVVDKLILALSTPSQSVQQAVSRCLPALVPRISARVPELIEQLLQDVLEGSSYGVRRGAAFGLAGLVKGQGLSSLKQCNIMSRLQEAVQNKKRVVHREGALLAFETLCVTLGRLFEPYIITVLPHMLACFGDGNKDVRAATEDTARVIMGNLSAHGVKLVLPALLEALEDRAWRTKQGSAEMLGKMAFCAPKQLSSCLPTIVPRLTEVLADSHIKVQEAGALALKQIGSVIRNPEVQLIVPTLLDALARPDAAAQRSLSQLLHTEFVHFIDAPSLALIMPIVERALMSRSTDTKRMAAQIVGNMSNLTDHKDLAPYLPSLVPGIKQVLLDPIPEVRGIASKALGRMVRAMGEQTFNDLVPWLRATMEADTGTVDRAGAAQGLSEVLLTLGTDRLRDFMEVAIEGCRSEFPWTREGYTMLFIYMPSVFGDALLPYVGPVLPALLEGLADEHEYVRDAALKAGQMIINHFADTSVELLLPHLDQGLCDANWRIRQSSVQLLGDLLYSLGGLSGKKSTIGDEDEGFGTEEAQKMIAVALGAERRRRVLAGLYLARQDVQLVVRQLAMHVWKTVVVNTTRTVRELLPVLMTLILDALASTTVDRRTVAARTLGDIVRKLGDRVLPDILQIIETGLNAASEPGRREGVCIALHEIISSTTRDTIESYTSILIMSVRRALSDESEAVRKAAGKTFAALYGACGAVAIDGVVPPLLSALKSTDESKSTLALAGLRELMGVKSNAVLPFLVPKLTVQPVTPFNAQALASLVGVAGEALNRHLPVIIKALVMSVSARGCSPAVEEAACELISKVETVDGVLSMTEDLCALMREQLPEVRCAATKLLCAYCGSESFVYDEEVFDTLLDAAMQRMADAAEDVVAISWEAFNHLMEQAPAEELPVILPMIRRALSAHTSGLTLLPGFCLAHGNGIKPVLGLLLTGMKSGTSETREQCASTLSDVICLTDQVGLKAHIRTITGKLIGVFGEQSSPHVKASLLYAMRDLMKQAQLLIKMFLPQLQPTCTKALRDPKRPVRVAAGAALEYLVMYIPRLDRLLAEVNTAVQTHGTDAEADVCETTLAALVKILSASLERASDENKRLLMESLQGCLAHPSSTLRDSAADALSVLYTGLNEEQQSAIVSAATATVSTDDAEGVALTLGRIQLLSRLLYRDASGVLAEPATADLIGRLLRSSNITLVRSVASTAALFCAQSLAYNQQSPPSEMIQLLVSRTDAQNSNDTVIPILDAIRFATKHAPLGRAGLRPLLLSACLAAVGRDRSQPVRHAADRAIYYLFSVDQGLAEVDSYVASKKIVDANVAKMLSDTARRALENALEADSDAES